MSGGLTWRLLHGLLLVRHILYAHRCHVLLLLLSLIVMMMMVGRCRIRRYRVLGRGRIRLRTGFQTSPSVLLQLLMFLLSSRHRRQVSHRSRATNGGWSHNVRWGCGCECGEVGRASSSDAAAVDVVEELIRY